MSRIAYLPEEQAREQVSCFGLTGCRYLEADGAQAYLFWSDEDAVVVCRGTEIDDWNDVQADINAWSALAETVGRVHRGFKREVDDLWPMLEDALVANQKTLWFSGHSLGGAMATICAGRCKLSHIASTPEALFTFGSPRVGNRRYVHHARLRHYRWVNNNDIVCRVPPKWMGYSHAGQEWYLSSRGRLRRMQGWQKVLDRARGFVRGLFAGTIDQLNDHLMHNYIDAIQTASKSGIPEMLQAQVSAAAHVSSPPRPQLVKPRRVDDRPAEGVA
ncbi:MAG: lipase family protein [Planctomycetota bacterium]